MKKIIGIYKITSPTGRIYIGESMDCNSRWGKHYKSLNCKSQTRLYSSFSKHGWENHTFDILEECSVSDLKTKERFYQEKYDVLNQHKGLNCLLTSTSEKKQVLSESTRRKISEAQKGHVPNENQKRALDEGRRYVKLLQYDLEGNLLKTWNTIKEAITNNTFDICSHLYGSKSHAGGYLWVSDCDLKSISDKIDIYHRRIESIGSYTRSEKQIKDATNNIVTYNKSKKGKSRLDKFKNEIIKDYQTYSVGYLTNKYECTKQTMIPYLKNLGIYEFRKNYQKLI